MTYDTAEVSQELLATIAEAIDGLDVALAALGAAYEQLNKLNADVLEAVLPARSRPRTGARSAPMPRLPSATGWWAGRSCRASRTPRRTPCGAIR